MTGPNTGRAVRVDVERLTVAVVELVRVTAVQRARIAAYMSSEGPFSDFEAAATQWHDAACGFAGLVHPPQRSGFESSGCFALGRAVTRRFPPRDRPLR